MILIYLMLQITWPNQGSINYPLAFIFIFENFLFEEKLPFVSKTIITKCLSFNWNLGLDQIKNETKINTCVVNITKKCFN